MDSILVIIAGLIGLTVTCLIASRYRSPFDFSDELRSGARYRQAQTMFHYQKE